MPTIDFNNVPSNVSFSEERVQYLSDRATEVSTAFSRRIEKLQELIAEARDRYTREADEIIASAAPEDRAAARQFAKKAEANKVIQYRRNLIASSESERTEKLKALKSCADEAAAIQAICATPAMILGRVALGDNKRTQYMQQLEGAGPVELETAARQAIMTNDMVLAAAIVTVVDRRPKDRRPFTVSSFAERMMGLGWERVNAKLKGIQLAFDSALAAEREFVRSKADPNSRVALALSRKAVAEAEGKIAAEEEKIAQAGANAP